MAETTNKLIRAEPPLLPIPVSYTEAITIPQTTEQQIVMLTVNTPSRFIKQRKGRGEKVFDYIETNYVIARLNATFFFNWDLEVLWQDVNMKEGQISVRVRLTVRFLDGRIVVKEAYGSAEVKRSRVSAEIIDLADDLKAAESDALKKAASMLGVGWDVYAGLAQSEDKPVDKKPKRDNKEFLDDVKGTRYAEGEVGAQDSGETPKDIILTKANGKKVKVTKFEALAYFQKVKKAIGEEAYYAILELNGYKKSNAIPPKKVALVYANLVEAWNSREPVKKEKE